MSGGPRRALLACVALLAGRCSCEPPPGLDAGPFACEGDGDCAQGWLCLAGVCWPVGADAGSPFDAGPPPLDGGAVALRFTTAPRSSRVNACSSEVGLELADDAGATLTAQTDVPVQLSGSGLELYLDGQCTTPVSLLQLRRDAGVFFLGRSPGSFPLIATSPLAAPAAQTQTVGPSGAVRLQLVDSAPPPAIAGSCVPLQLELRDVDDAGVAAAAPLTVAIDAVPAGLRCFTAGDCSGTEVQAVTFPAGARAVSVHCTARTGADYAVSAAAAGLDPAQATLRLRPVVVTGACDFAQGEFMKMCAVSPPQLQPARTFLVYQATSPRRDTQDATVSCVLESASAVRCSRFQVNGAASVAWQTVELRDARVDRYAYSCNPDGGDEVSVGLDASVQPASAFLLSAGCQAGADFNSNDTFTVRWGNASRLDLRWGGYCNSRSLELQVVQVPGFSVERATGSLSGGLTAQAMVPAAAGDSFTLGTWRSSASVDSNRLCDRVVRFDLPSAGVVSARRGDGSTASQCTEFDVDEWRAERVDVGARARVQRLVVALAANTATERRAITAVDPSRTFVLASGQTGGGGQGMGESSSPVDGGAYVGEAAAKLTLASPTEVQLDRGSSAFSARFTVFVVELEP